MSRKKIITLAICLMIVFVGWSLWSLYHILPSSKAKPQIQAFLDRKHNNQFRISTIEVDYSQDLFHQPIGYKLVLTDANGIKFGNVFIEFNKYQNGWMTYGGTDIEKEYSNAKTK